jgi:hypothetical protein
METMPFVKCKHCGQIFHSVPILERHFRDHHASTDEDTDDLAGMVSTLGAAIIDDVLSNDLPPEASPDPPPDAPPDSPIGDGGSFGGGGVTDSF